MISDLEYISESIDKTITEIEENLTPTEKRKLQPLLNNLRFYNDRIYYIYENDNSEDIKTEMEQILLQNQVLKNLLLEKIDFAEALYLENKYQIEL